MNHSKIARFQQAFAAMLTAAWVVGIGLLSAQAQEGNLGLSAGGTNGSPKNEVQALPTIVVTGVGPSRDPKADKAWQDLERAEKAVPHLPIGFCWKLEFQSVLPEDVGKFLDKTWIAEELGKADKARDFFARFPFYPKVWDAQVWEYENLVQAYGCMSSWNEAVANMQQSGLLARPQVWSCTNFEPRLMALEKLLLEKTNLPPSTEFRFRAGRVERLSAGPEQEWLEAAKALQKDFPEEEHAYDSLRSLIARSNDDQAHKLAQGVLNSPAPEKVKTLMRTTLRQLDLKGKPVSLRFTALDGRKVDTATMRGNVVLMAFWEPDEISELLTQKALYEKFHAQGLETFGIALGQTNQKARLEKLLKAQRIAWPQYFDGNGWDSELARRFGISQSPALLLLDKQGVLREINTQTVGIPIPANGVMENVGVVSASQPPGNLEQQIRRLLAESPPAQ
jgi:hypothetical protein